MKKNNNLIICLFMLLSITLSAQSLQIRGYGLYNKTIQDKAIDNIIGLNLGGFSPKYGYQYGFLYQYPVFKQLRLGLELGHLNKGHQTFDPRTQEKLYEVNYNYIYLKPSLGFEYYNFTVSAGLNFDFLFNKDKLKTPGTVTDKEIAYSFELSYHYKRIGLSIGVNESLKPIQKISIVGNQFEHFHHWNTIGLSYTLFRN